MKPHHIIGRPWVMTPEISALKREIDRYRNISEPFEARLRRWRREDLALQLQVAAILLVYGAAAFALGLCWQ